MIRKLMLLCLLTPVVVQAPGCARLADAAEREAALRREINRGGGVAANAHEMVVLFNERRQTEKFLFVFNLNTASYLRKDIALIDYGYPVSAAEIAVQDGTLRVVIPELRAVGVDRFIDRSFSKGKFAGKDIEGDINESIQAHIRNSRYRCDILYSTTRLYFQTLARKYGYALDFQVRDSTCKNAPNGATVADATASVTAALEKAGAGKATEAARDSIVGRVLRNLFGR